MYDEKEAALLQAAIRAVARDGLEKTTTRSIGAAAGINDAYIYRYFKDKEELLSRAYIDANEHLVKLLLHRIGEAGKMAIEYGRERFAYVARGLWDVLLENAELCLFCDYYYHSASYQKYAADAHHTLALSLLEKMEERYTIAERAEYSLYYLMESIFGFAARAITGRYPKGEDGFEQMLDQLYQIFCSFVTA